MVVIIIKMAALTQGKLDLSKMTILLILLFVPLFLSISPKNWRGKLGKRQMK